MATASSPESAARSNIIGFIVLHFEKNKTLFLGSMRNCWPMGDTLNTRLGLLITVSNERLQFSILILQSSPAAPDPSTVKHSLGLS